ncbi:Uncharacterised protein [uncultured Blautia sp.]|nr:Uncharacterised protein [uncultured Blautia sp.]
MPFLILIYDFRHKKKTYFHVACSLYHRRHEKSSLFPYICGFRVTVQPVTIPRGVTLHLQRDPEDSRCQTAILAVCVHTFVTVKPKG